MGLPAGKMESSNDVSDENREAGKLASRARLRTVELLQKPFDVRSIALTGLFILAVFYTIYFMRSILLPIVLLRPRWNGSRKHRPVWQNCNTSSCR